MGNYISCTISKSTYKNCKGTKVILPTGEVRQFDFPIQAAEMMFESPNYFLVNTTSLRIGGRFNALNADEDLEMSNVYAMYPMKRLNSIVTASDMGKLLVTAHSTNKRARVTPEFVTMGVVAVAKAEPRRKLKPPPKPQPLLELQPEPEPEPQQEPEPEQESIPELPKLPELCLEFDITDIEIEDFSITQLKNRLSMCRKKPALETILEDQPVH